MSKKSDTTAYLVLLRNMPDAYAMLAKNLHAASQKSKLPLSVAMSPDSSKLFEGIKTLPDRKLGLLMKVFLDVKKMGGLNDLSNYDEKQLLNFHDDMKRLVKKLDEVIR